MIRGEVYRIYKGNKTDTKDFRLFVIISRQPLIDSNHSTVICAPIYSSFHSLSTQVLLDENDGMKKICSIHCDELISVPKNKLQHYVKTLNEQKIETLNRALLIAVGLG